MTCNITLRLDKLTIPNLLIMQRIRLHLVRKPLSNFFCCSSHQLLCLCCNNKYHYLSLLQLLVSLILAGILIIEPAVNKLTTFDITVAASGHFPLLPALSVEVEILYLQSEYLWYREDIQCLKNIIFLYRIKGKNDQVLPSQG